MSLRKISADVWVSLVLIVWSVWWYVLAEAFDNIDAELWPKGVLILTVILSVLLMLSGIKKSMSKENKENGDPKVFIGSLISFLGIIIYAITMEYVGFFIATGIFCPISMFLLGSRNWKAIICVTAGLNVFVYILFVTQLQLQMP